MEFLSDYGLFLAKTVTFVIAIGVIVAIIVAAGSKSHHKEKGEIEVKRINDRFKHMRHNIESVVLSDDELKKRHKAEKKAEKAASKLSKKKDSQASEQPKKRIFVTEFDGDIKASDTESLREVVSAVLSIAGPEDEVVVKLESQGGMVHSYGLASSQLARITEKNIPLTVCVDKVAASGGYMMACVANKILAAPFAVIGSIGVVAQLPNFHRLLKKNNVDYEMLTAGEYKRTLTMFGENTDKGRKKFEEDLEDTHVLFKEFIAENRPGLDVPSVATGEVWFGKRALEKNLIDQIKTSDAYLFDLHEEEFDIYNVSYEIKKSLPEKLGIGVHSAMQSAFEGLLTKLNNKIFS